MTMPPPKLCERICQLHALMGSANANEAQVAHDRLLRLLAKLGLTWNDLPTVLAARVPTDTSAAPQAATVAADTPTVNVLDLVVRLIELHIAITAEERIAVALWILHTYVFDRFTITPRLALISPVRGCGKTTLLVLLELLVAEPYRTDNVTAAAIYYLLDRKRHSSLLVDEGDNSRSAPQRRAALGLQFRAPEWRDHLPVCRRLVAEIPDFFSTCSGGNRCAAPTTAAPCCRDQYAALRAQ
jgi:hypothetical protein